MIQTQVPKKTTSSSSSKKKVYIPDVLYHKYVSEDGEEHNVKYIKGNFLGKGGFAECYELIDSETKRIFAGKIIPKDSLTSAKSKQKVKIKRKNNF